MYSDPTVSPKHSPFRPIPYEGLSIRLSKKEKAKAIPIVYVYLGRGLARKANVKVGDYLQLLVDSKSWEGCLVKSTKQEGGRCVTAGNGVIEPKKGTVMDCFIQVPFRNLELLEQLFGSRLQVRKLNVLGAKITSIGNINFEWYYDSLNDEGKPKQKYAGV